MAKGKFISIEGGEGVGKSTQIRALADAIEKAGFEVVITREPGGTEGAEAIRELLLGGSADRWLSRAEALLFAAARSDHVEKLIKPSLEAGKWVISDRFVDSSRAYQSGGSGIDDDVIMTIHGIGSDGFLPDRTLVLILDADEAARRAAERDANRPDRIGGRASDYHGRVDATFRVIAAKESARVRLVDASGDAETVTARLLAQVRDLFP